MDEDHGKERLIKEIRRLVRAKCGRKAGLLYDRWTQQDVGISSTRFLVINGIGVYEGYYIDGDRIPKSERTIICNIVGSEECMEWEAMSADQLEPYLAFLKERHEP